MHAKSNLEVRIRSEARENKTYTKFYFKKLVCFALKLIKFASKHDSYSNRTVGFRILISIYIFASEWLPFQTANVIL